MEYFKEAKSLDDLKQIYKRLAKQFHPDLGGCTETMKAINEQYEKLSTKLWKPRESEGVGIDEMLAGEKAIRDKIMAVIHLAGIELEICGSWIWATGETRQHKETLRREGFFWASNKKAWYWRENPRRKRSAKVYTLDEIRHSYGSQTIKTKNQLRTA